ncbi:MAG: AI-2E family transporter [Lachnospiraceae bacterium]|nr:AI-2E family transporter [Lachnospiraceae bacterium]
MKEKYSNYFRWGITVMSIIVFGVLFLFLVFRMDVILGFLSKISSILFPVIFGAAIAYLINPLVTISDRWLNRFFSLCHLPVKLSRFLAKAISITICLGLLIAGVALLCSMVVPELYSSILKLAGDFQNYVDTIYKFINEHLENNPELLSYAQNLLNSLTAFINNWVTNELILQVQTIISKLSVGLSWIVTLLTNMVVSIIISVYLLVSKERFLGQLKKLLYVFFKPEKANVALSIFRQVNKIFGGFISGKIIDSLIIGILCFIGVSVLEMPYPLLISVIVGVTNVIPFFGPYIGAIPSAFLVLLIDPSKFLVFVIFILVLQQIDGNIIGPTILGDSTGLSPFWVVVSILVGGGLFGFIGMLLGVPTFAVLYFLVKTFSEYYLKKKQLPTDSMTYCRLDKIDPETKNVSFLPRQHVSRRKQTDHGLMEALDKISARKRQQEPKPHTESVDSSKTPASNDKPESEDRS